MMRLPFLRFVLGATVATLAMCGGFVGAASRSFQGPARANAKLWLTASCRMAPTGTTAMRAMSRYRIINRFPSQPMADGC